MLSSQTYNKLRDVATELLPLHQGRTYAIRTVHSVTGEVVTYPVGRKHPDGTRECPDLTADDLVWHLLGQRWRGNAWVPYRLSVYPLIPGDPRDPCAPCDRTWFIAADFDDHERYGDVRKLLLHLRPLQALAWDLGLALYLEVSSGGHGVHAWLYFSERVPAVDARLLLYCLLRGSGVIELPAPWTYNNELFPGHDAVPVTGLGYPIALPHNGFALGVRDRSVIVRLRDVAPDKNLPWVGPIDFARHAMARRADQLTVNKALAQLDAAGHGYTVPPSRNGAGPRRHRKRLHRGTEELADTAPFDWASFLADAGVAFEQREGVGEDARPGFLYLEHCPFGTHRSGTYKFYVNAVSGWGNCWSAHCEAHEGVPPSRWCEQLQITLPRVAIAENATHTVLAAANTAPVREDRRPLYFDADRVLERCEALHAFSSKNTLTRIELHALLAIVAPLRNGPEAIHDTLCCLSDAKEQELYPEHVIDRLVEAYRNSIPWRCATMQRYGLCEYEDGPTCPAMAGQKGQSPIGLGRAERRATFRTATAEPRETDDEIRARLYRRGSSKQV